MLGLLLDGGAWSGYDLQKKATASVSHFWPVTKAHVYSELPKLEAAGFVTGAAVAQSGAPDKRLYTATDTGRAALSAWLERLPLTDAKLRHPLLLQVFFACQLDPAILRRSAEAHLVEDEARLERLESLLATPARLDHPAERWRRLVVRHAVNRLRADRDWLRELLVELVDDGS